jgi:hypothetical protein
MAAVHTVIAAAHTAFAAAHTAIAVSDALQISMKHLPATNV